MKTFVALYSTFFVAVGMGCARESSKDPTGLALIRGIEMTRAKYDNLRVELLLEYADRTQRCTIPCLVEQAGQRRRFEQFADGCLKEGEVILVNDRELWGYRRKKYEDLEIYDMERSVGVRGDTAFDPRIIGLGDIVTPSDVTLRQLLWIDCCDRVKVLGREEVNGISTWHVQATWDNAISDFWIEEPSFRLHRCVCQCPGIRTENLSEFDPKDRSFLFPKRVQVTREEGNKWRRLEITVKSFEVDKPIPDERFTMKSIGLPVNTMINDYRINRIIGYWDGDGISKQPVPEGQSSFPPTPPHGKRLLLIWINLLFLLPLLVAIWWRWRKSAAAAK